MRVTLCQGSSLNFICPNVPMEIFCFYEMRKKREEIKGELFTEGEGGSYTRVFS